LNTEKFKLRDVRPTSILFIHGMWHAVWYWAERFLPNFAKHGYPSLALSRRGHGASEGIERLRRTSLTDYVVDVAQVDSQLKTPPVRDL